MPIKYLIPTCSAEHLVKKLVRFSDIKIIRPGNNKDNKRFFPDGEVYANLPELKNKNARYKRLYLTNTIKNVGSNVDVTELIFKAVNFKRSFKANK